MNHSLSPVWNFPVSVGACLAREPGPRIPPFLSDGRGLYEVLDWSPGLSPEAVFRVRRLGTSEDRQVRAQLLEAAEDICYRLPRRRRE